MLVVSGPNEVKSYQNKSTYSPDWLFCIKNDGISALNTADSSLGFQNTIFEELMADPKTVPDE